MSYLYCKKCDKIISSSNHDVCADCGTYMMENEKIGIGCLIAIFLYICITAVCAVAIITYFISLSN